MATRVGRPRRGLQAELLLGLALVMATATSVLLLLGLRIQDERLALVWPLAARALSHDAATTPGPTASAIGADAWRIGPGGAAVSLFGAPHIDAASRELAGRSGSLRTSLRGPQPLAQRGAPGGPQLSPRSRTP